MLDAVVDVARVQDPFPGRDAAEHLLASRQVLRNQVGHVGVVEGQVAELGVVLRQESDESEKAQKVVFGKTPEKGRHRKDCGGAAAMKASI